MHVRATNLGAATQYVQCQRPAGLRKQGEGKLRQQTGSLWTMATGPCRVFTASANCCHSIGNSSGITSDMLSQTCVKQNLTTQFIDCVQRSESYAPLKLDHPDPCCCYSIHLWARIVQQ